MMLPTLDQVREATGLLRATLPPTPQYQWPLLCRRTGVRVWTKHENHLPIGAFKVRGGLILVDELVKAGAGGQGLVTATRGNHGQSIAFAASRHQLRCVVVVPHGNSSEKNSAMKAWGAELIEHGNDFNDALDCAEQMADQEGLRFVPSFAPPLICGVATYWLEFFSAVSVDAVYVPIGLGSGICAGIAVRDGLGLATRIIGVVSEAAPAYALSLASGEPVEHPTKTLLADGVAVRKPHAAALAIIRRGVERIVQVSDDEVAAAMRAYFTDTHNVVEGAGAAPLAALLKEREQMRRHEVGLVVTGGNVDREVFGRVLSS